MDKRTYRKCVRVVIIKNNKILLGKQYIKGEFVYYEFPGGGVEHNDTFEETVKKECLEEVGVLVDNINFLNLQYRYEVNYPKPERAKLYRGGEDNWFSCHYVKEDKSIYGDDNDKLEYIWVTIDEAIKLILNGPESRFNPTRLAALNKIINNKNKIEKPNFVKW